MARFISAGIDIGTHNTRVVVVEADNNSNRKFKVIGKGIAESRGLRHGYIVNLDDAVGGIQEARKEAEKAAGVKIKKALISIGGIGVESTTTSSSTIISHANGEVTSTDVEKIIELSEKNITQTNKKIIHRFPLFFKLDNKEILGRPHGMRGMKLETRVLFVTCLDQRPYQCN